MMLLLLLLLLLVLLLLLLLLLDQMCTAQRASQAVDGSSCAAVVFCSCSDQQISAAYPR